MRGKKVNDQEKFWARLGHGNGIRQGGGRVWTGKLGAGLGQGDTFIENGFKVPTQPGNNRIISVFS